MVSLIINGKPVCVPEGTSILEAARAANIDIPTLCYLKDLNEIGACRICMVEVEGQDTLVAACDNEVHEGMVVHTNSQKVRMTRRVNLQLLLSQHEVNCVKCTRSGNCKLQKLANDYNLLGAPYQKKLRPAPVDYSAPILRFENRCVKCMRCVQVCDKVQGVHIWDLVGTGSRTTVGTAKADSLSQSLCTYCGQCVTHCPVGALEERDDTDHVYRMLADPTLTTVVQVAPAVRAAWTEYFGLSPEQAAPGVLASALRELGFDYVFDTNFSADLTIMEEGSEFIERFTHKDAYSWPMFTSCCPGWVRFVKGQFPQFAKNLSTAKSPQQMFGAVAKSYFAEKIGIDPKNLRVISVMPCTSKKAEAALPTMKDACGGPDVDVVMGQGLGGASTCLLIATAGAIVSYIPIGQIASKIGRKRTIQGGIILLTACFASGYVLTTTFSSINAIMFVVFALVGLAWAAINVNSLPMVVEMCKGSDIGKFTGYYYTASMAAQVVTPIVAGTLMRKIDYRVLFPYAAMFVALSFVTMLFVHHGDAKAEAKKGLEAFEEMDD